MSTYLDEDFNIPTVAEQFTGLTYCYPSSPLWLEPRVRSPELHARLSSQQKQELIGYLATGLVRAFSTHAFVQMRYGTDQSFKSISSALKWISQWQYSGGAEEALHGCFEIPKTFWQPLHSDNSPWAGDVTFPFMECALADWSIGKFGSIYDRHGISDWGNEPLEQAAVGQVVFFSVEFLENDVEATFGKIEKASRARSTTYDWESAFADVAASFYHDTEFENIDARGNQARVVDLLRASFETRGLAVPSDDTMKPKAKIILGALRSKKP